MTIDEAIEQETFKARIDKIRANKKIFHNNDEDEISACHRSAEEHEQLAEWLEELKDYKDKNKMVVRIDCANSDEFKDMAVKLAKEQYNKALNDFVNACEKQFTTMYGQRYIDMRNIKEIAEQLKAGVMNETN